MISEKELQMLKEFDGRGSLALSVYLRLDTPEKRRRAYETFRRCIAPYLNGNGTDAALREDLDLIKVYLQTNGVKYAAGLAIFSCADRLFWRAYQLPVPVPDHVELGPTFNVQPLEEALREQEYALVTLLQKERVA